MIDQETQRGLVRSIASKVEGLTEGPLLDPMIQKLSFLRSAGQVLWLGATLPSRRCMLGAASCVLSVNGAAL